MQIERAREAELDRLPFLQYLALQPKIHLEPALVRLGGLESRLLRRKLRGREVDRPIYITGLARAGTTISLELLSQHPDIAAHRYRDQVQPHLPYAWNWAFQHLRPPAFLYPKPAERLHKDGMVVTPDSPEALEETIWKFFFPGLHDEHRSAVLGADTANPAFERYYTDHISKLLLATGRSRYLAKANYNVTRISYLTRLFPGARFLVMVRHPAAHLASWLKQDELMSRMLAHDPRWKKSAESIGHHEFGTGLRRFINTGDNARVQQVRQAWDRGETARAFGWYWSSVYGHVLDLSARDPRVREAVTFVRYEDLCADPGPVIDRMLAHAGLDPAGFGPARASYCQRLRAPDYYRVTLDAAESRDLAATTSEVAAAFGYHPDPAARVPGN